MGTFQDALTHQSWVFKEKVLENLFKKMYWKESIEINQSETRLDKDSLKNLFINMKPEYNIFNQCCSKTFLAKYSKLSLKII